MLPFPDVFYTVGALSPPVSRAVGSCRDSLAAGSPTQCEREAASWRSQCPVRSHDPVESGPRLPLNFLKIKWDVVAPQGGVSYYEIIMISMIGIPNDTDKATEQAYLQMLREAPPWRKAAMVNGLTQACQELAVAGIRMRHPDASGEDIRMRVAALWLSREMMMRVFGWDPESKGY